MKTDDLKQEKLGFGRYHGDSVWDMMGCNPIYIRYLLENSTKDGFQMVLWQYDPYHKMEKNGGFPQNRDGLFKKRQYVWMDGWMVYE